MKPDYEYKIKATVEDSQLKELEQRLAKAIKIDLELNNKDAFVKETISAISDTIKAMKSSYSIDLNDIIKTDEFTESLRTITDTFAQTKSSLEGSQKGISSIVKDITGSVKKLSDGDFQKNLSMLNNMPKADKTPSVPAKKQTPYQINVSDKDAAHILKKYYDDDDGFDDFLKYTKTLETGKKNLRSIFSKMNNIRDENGALDEQDFYELYRSSIKNARGSSNPDNIRLIKEIDSITEDSLNVSESSSLKAIATDAANLAKNLKAVNEEKGKLLDGLPADGNLPSSGQQPPDPQAPTLSVEDQAKLASVIDEVVIQLRALAEEVVTAIQKVSTVTADIEKGNVDPENPAKKTPTKKTSKKKQADPAPSTSQAQNPSQNSNQTQNSNQNQNLNQLPPSVANPLSDKDFFDKFTALQKRLIDADNFADGIKKSISQNNTKGGQVKLDSKLQKQWEDADKIARQREDELWNFLNLNANASTPRNISDATMRKLQKNADTSERNKAKTENTIDANTAKKIDASIQKKTTEYVAARKEYDKYRALYDEKAASGTDPQQALFLEQQMRDAKNRASEILKDILAMSQTNGFKATQKGSEAVKKAVADVKKSTQETDQKIGRAQATRADTATAKAASDDRKRNTFLTTGDGKTYNAQADILANNSAGKITAYNTAVAGLRQKIGELDAFVNKPDFLDPDAYDLNKEHAKALKKEIDGLISTLSKDELYSAKDYERMLPTGLSAGDAGDQLKAHISGLKGVNADTIKLSSSTKSATGEIASMTYQIKGNGNQVKEMKATYNSLTGVVKTFVTQEKKMTTGMDVFGSSLKTKMGQMATYFASFGILHEVFAVVRQGISTITDLDAAMVEVRKVSDETTESYEKFGDVISNTAVKVASTNQELLNSSADWMRNGYNLEESADLAATTAVYVNVGDGIDVDTATSDLVSNLKAYNLEATEAMHLVDTFNEVGNNFALSSSDIGESLSRAGSVLATGGNSFEESVAMVTAMNEIVQNAETTGSTLKILGLRLRSSAVEVEEAGESADGMATSTAKLRDKILALTAVNGGKGVDIMLDNSTIKSTMDIMNDIAGVYGEMSDIDQAALLELIAGKNRANGVAALLNNWEQVAHVMDSIDESDGSALQENEAIVDSINGKVKIFQATCEDFWNSAIDSGVVKGVIDAGTKLISLLTDLIDNGNGLGLAIGGISLISLTKESLALGRNIGNTSTALGSLIAQGEMLKNMGAFMAGGNLAQNLDTFVAQDKWAQNGIINNSPELLNLLGITGDLDKSEQKKIKSAFSNSMKELFSDQKIQVSDLLEFTDGDVLKDVKNFQDLGFADDITEVTMSQLLQQSAMDDYADEMARVIVQKKTNISLDKEQLAATGKAIAGQKKSVGGLKAVVEGYKTAALSIASFIASNIAIIGAVVGVIAAVGITVALIDKYNETLEEHREAVEKAKDAYDGAVGELDEINSKLEENSARIKELNSFDSLTYVEKSELESLKEANKLLELNKKIQQQEVTNKQKELGEEAFGLVQGISKETLTEDKYQDLVNYISTIPTYSNGTVYNDGTMLSEAETLPSVDSELGKELFFLQQDQEYLDDLIARGETDTDTLIDNIDDKKSKITGYLNELLESRDDMEEYYHFLAQKTRTERSDDQNAYVDTYEGILETIKFVHSQLDPDGWNAIEMDAILDADGIEKTKDELIDMAKSGKLNEGVISGYKNLNQALNESNLILQDGETNASAFIAELTTLGDRIEENAHINFSEMSEDYAEKIRSALIMSPEDTKFSVSSNMENMSAIQEALKEQNDSGYISTNTYDALIAKNGELEEHFHMTASGIKLDMNEAAEVTKKAHEEMNDAIDEDISNQKLLYEENEKAIQGYRDELYATSDATRQMEIRGFIDELEASNDGIVNNVESLQKYQNELNGANSAYKAWMSGQDAAQDRDPYMNMVEGLTKFKELKAGGFVGDSRYQDYITMMTGKEDNSGASATNAVAVSNRYFSKDGTKSIKLMEDLYEAQKLVGAEWVTLNEATGDFETLNISDDVLAAEALSEYLSSTGVLAADATVSATAMQAVFGMLNDFGGEITIDSASGSLEDMREELEAVDKLLEDNADSSFLKEYKAKLEVEIETKEAKELESTIPTEQEDLIARAEEKRDNLRARARINENAMDYVGDTDPTYEQHAENYALNYGGAEAIDDILSQIEASKKLMEDSDISSNYYNSLVTHVKELEEELASLVLLSDNLDLSFMTELFEKDTANLSNELGGTAGIETLSSEIETLGAIDLDVDSDDVAVVAGDVEELSAYINNLCVEQEMTVEDEEVQDALSLMDYAIRQKQELSKPEILNFEIEDVDESLANVYNKALDFYRLMEENEHKQLLGLDTSDLEADIQNACTEYQNAVASANSAAENGEGVEVPAELNFPEGTPQQLYNQMRGVGEEGNSDDIVFSTTVNLSPSEIAINEFVNKPRRIRVYVDTVAGSGTTVSNGKATGTAISYPSQISNAFADGTNWSLQNDQNALVNELGNEGLVRDGKFHIIPGGAQFLKLKRGDIIFNHKQTEQLTKNGKLSGNGRGAPAFSGGTLGNISGIKPNVSKVVKSSTSASSVSSAVSSAATSAASSAEALADAMDWIAIKLDRMADATSKATDKIDLMKNSAGYYAQHSSYSSQNAQVNEAIKATIEERNVNAQAATAYQKQADSFASKNSGVLTSSIIDKIKNGKIQIEEFNENTQTAINEYKDLYEKASSCKDAVVELEKAQRDLEMSKLDNIQQHYDSRIEYYSALSDVAEATKDFENSAYDLYDGKVLDQYLTKAKTLYSNQATYLEAQSRDLSAQFAELEKAGVVTKYSEEWYSWKSAIEDVNAELLNTKTEMKELAAIKFDSLQEYYDILVGIQTLNSDKIRSTLDVKTLFGKDISSSEYKNAITASNNEMAKLRSQLSALSAEQDKLVKSGDLEYGSQQWYDMESAIQDVEIAINDALTTAEEYNREMFENGLKGFEHQITAIENVNDKLDQTISYYEAAGKAIDRDLYQQMIRNNDSLIATQEKEKALIQAEINRALELSKDSTGKVNYNSEYYQELLGQLRECESEIVDLKISQEDWNTAIFEMDISKIDEYLNRLAFAKDQIDAMMDLNETQGHDLEADSYNNLISNADGEIGFYNDKLALLREELETTEVGSKLYNDLLGQIEDLETEIINVKTAQEEWNDAIIDLRIEQLEKEREELETQNDELDRKIRLEKALDALAKARSQKNKLVYRDGYGFVYESDKDAIDSAEEDLNDAYYDDLLDKFDDAVDALEDLKDHNNIYDKNGDLIVDGMDDISGKTDKIVAAVNSAVDAFKNLVPVSEYDGVFKDPLAGVSLNALQQIPALSKTPSLNGVGDNGTVQYVQNTTNVTTSVSIGEIHLHEVESADDLWTSLNKELPNTSIQILNKK